MLETGIWGCLNGHQIFGYQVRVILKSRSLDTLVTFRIVLCFVYADVYDKLTINLH